MKPPLIAIISLFRDNVSDVKRICIERPLWSINPDDIIHICVEGDSKDDTYKRLRAIKDLKTIIIKKDLGNERYGSYAIPERLKALATLWNLGLDAAIDCNASNTMILDADLEVGPHVLAKLLSRHKDVIAPMLMWKHLPNEFRDTWAYFQGARDFMRRYPYHKVFKPDKLFQVDGVGAPLLRRDVIKSGVRFDDLEIRGFCGQIRKRGINIFVDPTAVIYHPEI